MANHVFRFYATSPEAVIDPIRRKWRSAVVRWDARKLGPHDMWLMVIVLDDRHAANWLDDWLLRYGRSRRLVLSGKSNREIVVDETIVVRRRLPVWRRLARSLRTLSSNKRAGTCFRRLVPYGAPRGVKGRHTSERSRSLKTAKNTPAAPTPTPSSGSGPTPPA